MPKQKKFMGKNFLLEGDTARALYFNYAAKLPIIDYHCHVSPREIACDKRFANITELWLGGDHYKWRAMRSCGVDERYITGDASDYDKFRAWCRIMPKLIGNPLYHWSHLELRRYFGINAVICEDSCDEIWACANEALASPEMSVRGIIKRSGVEAICTTDDPCDTLEYHREIAADDSFGVRVLPAWRPDKGINLDRRGYTDYISRLDSASGVAICGIVSLRDAYMRRLNFFAQNGCVTADMGIDEVIPYAAPLSDTELDMIFKKAYESDGADITPAEANAFRADMFRFFAAQYKQRGWVMQIHYGVLRNVNPAMFKKLGADTGFDIIGGRTSTTELARLLGSVEESSGLPRTVIYSVNPEDNAATAALIGAFQRSDGSGMPLLMQGSAWWFNDNLSGMKAQMETLANMSAFGCFLGMLTDSRSFISYTRHEYFRRILCNMIGSWADAGLIPNDPAALADIVMDICYNNTKNFFGF